MDIVLDETLLALVIGFIMAWAIGANDVANAMASTVGSRILTVRHAVIIAAIFEALGAMLASGEVTNMIRFGIVNVNDFANDPHMFIIGMFAALLAASSWLIIATIYGLPVSTTHTIVGSVLGFGIASVGPWRIAWYNLFEIVLGWIISPVLAIAVAYVIHKAISQYIFNANEPLTRATKFVPRCNAVLYMVFIFIALSSSKKTVGIELTSITITSLVLLTGIATYYISAYFTKKSIIPENTRIDTTNRIEKMFSSLAIATAAAMAFAHGANDIANAIGPVAAIITAADGADITNQSGHIPFWLLQYGAFAVVMGLITFGYRIMETVGSKITQLTPSRGFAAQLSTSLIIIVATGLGLPVSTTQIMVGSILGIGLARGLMAINLKVVKNIFISWSITIPAGLGLSIVFYTLLQHITKIQVNLL